MKTYFCDICGRYLSRRDCHDDIDEITPFPTGPLCPTCDCLVRARGLIYVLVGLAAAPLLGLLGWPRNTEDAENWPLGQPTRQGPASGTGNIAWSTDPLVGPQDTNAKEQAER